MPFESVNPSGPLVPVPVALIAVTIAFGIAKFETESTTFPEIPPDTSKTTLIFLVSTPAVTGMLLTD